MNSGTGCEDNTSSSGHLLNTLDVFERIMNNGSSYNKMLEYVKQLPAVLPRSHANLVIFAALTGLRPVEACNSVRQFIKTCPII